MAKTIGIISSSGTEWHIPSVAGSSYAILCGLDGDDTGADQLGIVEPRRGQKISCSDCKGIWRGVIELRLRSTDFE